MISSARSLLLGACALAAGCTTVTDTDCRSADWYGLGFRDAILAMQPQDLTYTEACAKHGVKVDTARYAQGWTEGRYEADNRHPQPTN
jgi:Protein of unknown function (DUF2799)